MNRSAQKPDLSVVLLCYKAKEQAIPVLETLQRSLTAHGIAHEVILVANYNAGDHDDTTPAVVRELAARDQSLIAVAQEKKGMYGWDVRSGLDRASGRVLVYIDGDGQDPMEDVALLYEKLVAENADIGIGYRVERYDGLHRILISRSYKMLLRMLFPRVRLRDPNSKPKMFTRRALSQMTLASDDWFIDAEIVIQGSYKGMKFVEVPTVLLKHAYRSTFVKTHDVWKFTLDLLKYRFNRSAPWRSRVVPMLQGLNVREWLVHVPALLAALTATLIVAGPVIAFPFVAGDHYRGINITAYGTDEHYYLSRMKEALDGNSLGQPFIRAGKDGQDTTFGYVEPALALPLRALGIAPLVNAATFVNVVNTIGVFILVLLLYAFAFRLTGHRAASIGAALFVVLGYPIIEHKTLFFSEPNIYGRSFYPFASSIPFTLFLIALYEAVVKKRPYAFLAAGTLAGILFYVYFFAWTFAFAILLSLGCIYLVLRDWRMVRGLVATGAVAVAIGSYNLVKLFQFLVSSMGTQVSYYQGQVQSHAPVMSKIGLGTIALAALTRYLRGRDDTTYFVWAIMLAGWIALNQQIVSGRVVQYGHYYWYFIVPVSIILAVYFVVRILPARYHMLLGVCLIALALVNGAGQQYRSFVRQFPEKLAEQRYAPILAALAQEKKSVIFAGEAAGTDPFLPAIYTSHDLDWIPAARLYGSSIEYLKEVLLLHLYLNKDARRDPVRYLNTLLKNGAPVSNEYVYLYMDIEGFYSGYEFYAYRDRLAAGETSFGGLRERLMQELARTYARSFGSPVAVRAILAEHGVEYVLWDKERYPEWDLSAFGKMQQIASSEGLVLYRLE